MTEYQAETPERELGADTSSVTCPNCGKELAEQSLPNGLTSYETCSKCYKPATKTEVKADVKEVASVPTPEVVTLAETERETGTTY